MNQLVYDMLIGSDHRIIAFIMPTLVFIPLVIATTKKSKNRQTPKK